MVDDIDAEYDRLQGKVDFHCSPVQVNGGRMAMGRDLYGNVLEFWQLGANDPQPFEPEFYPHGA